MKNQLNKSFVLSLIMTGMIVGCSDGKDGADGSDGGNGIIIAKSAESLHLEYLEYGIDDAGMRSASFKITNELNQPVVGIGSVRFLSSQLATSEQGYTERQGLGYVTCTSEAEDCLTDHEDGTYTVINTTSVNELDLSSKDYAYNPALPHRFMVRLQTYGGIPVIGSVQDIMPEVDFMVDGSAVTITRSMVDTASCNACHTDIAYARYDSYDRSPHYANNVQACATCHTTGEKDSKGSMVERAHRWHNGLDGDLVISSYDCTSCHVTEATDDLPNGAEWLANTTNDKACLSCHASEQLKHGPEMQFSCATCHDVAQYHLTKVDAKKAARDAYSVDVTQVSPLQGTSVRDGNSYNTAEITFTVKILDSEGTPLASSPKEAKVFNALRASVSWDMEAGYRMLTTETKDSGELGRLANHSVNFKFEGVDPISSNPATGEYTYVISGQLEDDKSKNATGVIIPVGTDLKTGILAIEGQVKADEKTGVPTPDGTLVERIRSKSVFFTLEGLTDSNRRQIVDNALCASCHGDQAYGYHGRRNDLEQQCVACHNLGNAEWDKGHMKLEQAPADPVLDHISWNTFVHALHAQNREEQNMGETSNRVFKYPARLNDCAQCHVDGSANLKEIEKSNALITRKTHKIDADFFATSPGAATCWSCHGPYGGDSLKNHMLQNGADFEVKLEDGVNATFDGDVVVDVTLSGEACSVCHSSDKLAESHRF